MKRKLLIAVLALGTVAGYGAGFMSMGCHRYHRFQMMKKEVARECADAALRIREERRRD